MSATLFKVVLGVLDIVQPLFNVYTGFGFLVTLICALFISPAVSPIIVPKYKDLEKHRKAHWNTLLGSTLYAVISTVTAIYLLLFDELSEEYIRSQSLVGKVFVKFSLGFFCADIILFMLESKMRGQTLSVMHHIGLLGVVGMWLPVYYDGVGLYWVVCQCIIEVSTPFVHLHYCLNAIGYPKKSPLFIVNLFLLMATFYSCRIMTIPYHWFGLYYYVYLDPSVTVLWPMFPWYCIVVILLLLDAFNLMWAYKLPRLLKKLLKSSD